MDKFCIFCGSNPPKEKNKEHVIPRWLIEATGDPKRTASFGVYYPDPKETKLREFSFDQFTFPACEVCNGIFSSLEGRAKPVVLSVLEERPLSESDFNVLLDWLDKVRVGLWLGLMQLTGNGNCQHAGKLRRSPDRRREKHQGIAADRRSSVVQEWAARHQHIPFHKARFQHSAPSMRSSTSSGHRFKGGNDSLIARFSRYKVAPVAVFA